MSCTRQIIPTGGRRKRIAIDDIDPTGGRVPCGGPDIQNCILFATMDQMNIPNVTALTNNNNLQIFDVIPAKCPPTKELAEINTMFEPQTGNCYKSRAVFIPNNVMGLLERQYNFISVCCYGESK